MDRAYTRYRRAVALARKRNILSYRWRGWGFLHRSYRGREAYPWQSDSIDGAHLMNEPGYWVHERMTVPARRRESALLRAVRAGEDAEGVVWPDNRKPHSYYW
jgi:hypothetical protein